jgi:hypothetical protein
VFSLCYLCEIDGVLEYVCSDSGTVPVMLSGKSRWLDRVEVSKREWYSWHSPSLAGSHPVFSLLSSFPLTLR